MDPEELKRMLLSSGLDLWSLIDTAIQVAAKEQGRELRSRRDSIVERLYAPSNADHCRNCVADNTSPAMKKISASPPSPPIDGEEDDFDEEEDEKSRIFAIKEFLDDPDQSEDSLVRLLQNLADMDITFKALKETDIGRNVNGLRKHPSNEVRLLVKHLVRKWKETVDEWVKSNSGGDAASPAIITDGESPQQNSSKNNQTGHQVQEFGHSPLTQNGFLSSEKNVRELVSEPRAKPVAPRREAPAKPINNNHYSTPSSVIPAKVKEQKDNLMDPERLASARKRLQENYQEAQNAKKQRTIQVMDIHDIPKKPKNSMVRKGGFQAKHW